MDLGTIIVGLVTLGIFALFVGFIAFASRPSKHTSSRDGRRSAGGTSSSDGGDGGFYYGGYDGGSDSGGGGDGGGGGD
ncbi:hypothetical protein FFR93_00445 [Rhizobium sp. MHM7A]|nr:hypothetical protein FFR93_00445 [Rhizobium sp. MHM7A]